VADPLGQRPVTGRLSDFRKGGWRKFFHGIAVWGRWQSESTALRWFQSRSCLP
jgi:hypothetical protein